MSVKQEDFDALKKQFDEMVEVLNSMKKSNDKKASKKAKESKESSGPNEPKEPKPKQPLSKYQEFVKTEYHVIKAANPDFKGPEIFKKVTENWKKLKATETTPVAAHTD